MVVVKSKVKSSNFLANQTRQPCPNPLIAIAACPSNECHSKKRLGKRSNFAHNRANTLDIKQEKDYAESDSSVPYIRLGLGHRDWRIVDYARRDKLHCLRTANQPTHGRNFHFDWNLRIGDRGSRTVCEWLITNGLAIAQTPNSIQS